MADEIKIVSPSDMVMGEVEAISIADTLTGWVSSSLLTKQKDNNEYIIPLSLKGCWIHSAVLNLVCERYNEVGWSSCTWSPSQNPNEIVFTLKR